MSCTLIYKPVADEGSVNADYVSGDITKLENVIGSLPRTVGHSERNLFEAIYEATGKDLYKELTDLIDKYDEILLSREC